MSPEHTPASAGWLGRGSRVAVGTATAGTVVIAAFAFWLSFTALTNLAQRSGVAGRQAWAWPLIVDGLIVVATVAVVALDRHRAAWYPWLLLMAGTLVSVTANALHATVAADPDVPGLLAGCVAAVPPLVLLASTHLTVVLVRSQRRPPNTTEAAEATEMVKADRPAFDMTEVEGDTAEVELLPEVVGGEEPTSDQGGRRELAAGLRVAGWSNKRIARHLGVAPSTVGRWLPRPGGETPVAPDRQGGPAAADAAGLLSERKELSA